MILQYHLGLPKHAPCEGASTNNLQPFKSLKYYKCQFWNTYLNPQSSEGETGKARQ